MEQIKYPEEVREEHVERQCQSEGISLEDLELQLRTQNRLVAFMLDLEPVREVAHV
jgi:hypothetical protein